ncbi:alpha/beta fold hydrolase [Poseidonocella sedimentorum]|uniref:Lysophospholipase n=1 Tax=Poseidonocella sedimentorum TaxID=871652 RepID=A0A1I6CWF8_9RHOB|nr:alpha/beta hydrolase [Poseidonocella sedimentorum]SFQ97462.1 lysophospholipase [Poseidonocella sedimentorum]
MSEAPYLSDIAAGPEQAICRWVDMGGALRIRMGAFPSPGARGTVLVFTGRTEFIEKYGPFARDFALRGLAMATCDWRGQGLSSRLVADPCVGHVEDFADYQADARALVEFARDEGLPEPYFLVAHSLGGCIGLRSLMEGLPVRAAVFSAPMWGIEINPVLRPLAWMLTALVSNSALGERYAPGTGRETYVDVEPFEGNQLTTDQATYEWLKSQTTAHPALQLGGPSIRWLHGALREMRALAAMPSPDMPCLTFLGTNERIVSPSRIHDRMRRWPGGELVMVDSAEHEVLMERPTMREPCLDRIAAFFHDNAQSNTPAARTG